MKKFIVAAAFAAAVTTASSASAALIADFQLNNSLANAVANSVTLSNNGAALGATGLTFGANAGPTISGLGVNPLTEYSLETRFRFDTLGGYQKVADFYDRSQDAGFYVLGQNLNFYPLATGNLLPFSAGVMSTVRLTRTSAGVLKGYVNGVEQFSTLDTLGRAVINGTGSNGKLHLFRDDFPTGQFESAAGFVDYVTLDSEAFRGGAVPEPAAWALMIGGFGMAGAMLRRRRALVA